MKIKRVDFYKHQIGPEEIVNCFQVLNSLILSTGPVSSRFEEEFAKYLGITNVVSVANGSIALEIALRALEIGFGDEVITTPLSFLATSNAILHTGACPIFIDVEPLTGILSIDLIEAAITSRTKAILPVYLYGMMCDIKKLRSIADRYGLYIIADCAHAIESTRDGLTSAQGVDVSCYSFYATKNLTCGEGGAIATDNSRLAKRLRCLRGHGIIDRDKVSYYNLYKHWNMITLGYKANLSDILASLLMPQISELDRRLYRREVIAYAYERAFNILPGVSFPIVPSGYDIRHARHLFTIWVKERDIFLNKLQAYGIGVSIHYRAIHLHPYYRKNFGYKVGDFPQAEYIGNSTLSLPLYPSMTEEEVERVIDSVIKVSGDIIEI